MSIFVVIPAFRESGTLIQTLASLNRSYLSLSRDDQQKIKVIVVCNRPKDVTINDEDDRCLHEANLAQTALQIPISVLDTLKEGLSFGVGQARKIGFDHAILQASKTDLLVSLDADTTVDDTYLSRLILKKMQPQTSGFTLEYQHSFLGPHGEKMALYELYLRYLKQGLLHSESPFAFIAMGSAMGTNVENYLKCGGMVLKNATEDYHFIQKLRKFGMIEHWGDIFVYPSNRVSIRVTLGTGYFLAHSLSLEDSLQKLLVPSHESFDHLKSLLIQLKSALGSHQTMRGVLEHFSIKPSLIEKLDLILKHSKQQKDFENKLLQVFDGIQTLRFLKTQNTLSSIEDFRKSCAHMFNISSATFTDMALDLQRKTRVGKTF